MRKKTDSRVAAIMLACCVLLGGCMSRPLSIGNAMPAVRVSGWTNGEAPNWQQLAGKVIVLEVFATW